MKLVRTEYEAERIAESLDLRNSRKYLCTENKFSAEEIVALLALKTSFCSELPFPSSWLSNFTPRRISTRAASANSDDEITCEKGKKGSMKEMKNITSMGNSKLYR